ncbi:MAG: acyltransferase family protein [Collinsella sp.]|nr:acyltransferase family protein [Collinsella sp.]
MGESASKSRITWIDTARGIAILLVIIGHTLAPSTARAVIYSFHMPLFFMLSGMTFRRKSAREVVVTGMRRLIVPYLLIFLMWTVAVKLAWTPVIDGGELFQLAGTLVFASGTTVEPFGFSAVGMSWFLVCLFFARLMLNTLIGVFGEDRRGMALTGLCSAIGCAVGVYVGGRLRVFLPFSLDLALVATFFLWAGHALARLESLGLPATERVLSSPAVLIALPVWYLAMGRSAFELAERTYQSPVLAIVAALAGSLLACAAARMIDRVRIGRGVPRIIRGLRWCGSNSMALYCVHAMDWWLPWANMAALAPLPAGAWMASALRIACALSFTKLVRGK